ncbi:MULTISPECIES: SDR family oxidoreductase [Pseudomonas]|jgi:NAD(P)-dependent dehydrogenase (short-subunit alcohol dehydrogenase family)|uniref:3-oxoacyl-[acyl-carrier-protein] reductase FabG n=2 Tax=Pseudomonas TaxID=286 RepID=A0A5E6P8I6_PSEFL|nr:MULTISPECIES: SDR family oxidoreductase [Pseudomonas]VVM13036.1 3-oxoacyl-[acyl-carrier-protein] reductase FabG [Pseudomonas fluorescens]AOE79512.1 dehydrogenase [Pseudomonas lurida]AVJ38391.1 dehydrogenase [Pseudomonas lurida]MBC3234100.1 SDR family oxidoreductase [Pseudomonas lurida]MBC3239591.1 SDR family oxidoreductase [Pseudomonas lurida]
MTSSLNGKTVIVIGGSSGIGAAVAKAAAARGAHVVMAGRRLVSGVENGVRSEPVDVTDATSLQRLFESVGRFDHLVYTSGPSVRAKTLVETDLTEAQENFDVKLWGALRAIQRALPYLDEHASISLTSGQLGRKLASGQFIKTGINAATEALGKQLAKELAPRRVNVISPGVIDTPAYAGLAEEQRLAMFAKAGGALPVGRVGQADEVAAGYVLAMENGFMTGAVIDIDGGGLL